MWLSLAGRDDRWHLSPPGANDPRERETEWIPSTHENVIPQLAEHLRPIFESSPDGVYVWLDEFVQEDDQEVFSWNYRNRVSAQAFPATFRFRGLHRNGSVLQLETDMIPLTFGGHTIAYHFVRRVGA